MIDKVDSIFGIPQFREILLPLIFEYHKNILFLCASFSFDYAIDFNIMYSGIYDNPYSAYAYGGEQANNQNTTPTINTNTENTEPSSNVPSFCSLHSRRIQFVQLFL